MDGAICNNCHSWVTQNAANCPQCSKTLYFDGENKNVIDRLQPNCLVHRYEGSDLLEPAVIIKECKTNMKVATKLKEYLSPVTIPKSKVYALDQTVLGAIQALRNERTAAIKRYDQLIQNHWRHLRPYEKR